MNKFISALTIGSLFLVLVLATPAEAATTVFTRNLGPGMRGSDVTLLQQFLTAQGAYSGPITGSYYSKTTQGVATFQRQQSISPASGYFGSITRARANAILTSQGTASSPQPTTATSAAPTGPAPSSPLVSAPQPAVQSTTQTQPAVSTGSVQWGAFTGYSPSDVTQFESLVGKQVNLVAIFSPWTDPFPTQFASTLCPTNRTLLIFWENYGFSLDNIIAGKYDSYLRSFSQGAQAYGCPVVISLFHEMNGNWDDWDGTVGTNSPAKVIAAWKHVHDLVTASNVKWAWAVNNESVPNVSENQIADYYPGSAYVDYVGIDGFNFGNPWQTFGQVFNSALSQVKSYNKPIYIFSMASASGSQKASWITDALTVQIPKDAIAGWIWFNENKEQNWTVNSDTASLTAFKAAVAK